MVLYHGDSRDVLETLDLSAVGLLLTDPPYGVEGGRGGDSKRGKTDYHTDLWQDTPDYIAGTIIPIITGILSEVARGIVTPGIRHLHLYPQARDIGCFWTPAAISHGPWGFVTFNPILYYGKDPRAGYGSTASGRMVTERAMTREHPCAKPLKAWEWLLDKGSAKKGELVLDPFAGAGTTLIAARNIGRRAIGIEIDERYCEVAARHLSEWGDPKVALEQSRLFGGHDE